MKNTMLFLLSFAFAFYSCSTSADDDSLQNSVCDENIVISQNLYQSAADDFVSIDSVVLEGDCLNISYSASGCDGDAWEVILLDANEILESFPVQRNIRFSLKNPEICLAYFTKELSFDISYLQLDQEASMYLNIQDWNEQILYEY